MVLCFYIFEIDLFFIPSLGDVLFVKLYQRKLSICQEIHYCYC